MMWGDGYAMGWGMWLVMGLATLAFWGVILLAVRALLPGRPAQDGVHQVDALAVLKGRLARGDITPEEYEQRRLLITSDGR